jgi:hypothetical protein
MFRSLCLAIITSASACNPSWNLRTLRVWGIDTPWLAANVKGQLNVQFRENLLGPAGLMLKDSSGAVAGKGNCTLVDEANAYQHCRIQCEVPALDAGGYSLFLSEDRTCGDKSYKITDHMYPNLTMVEPAQVAAIMPTHGPAASRTKITLQGTHFGGGEGMSCLFKFFAGPGTIKDGSGNPMGCGMPEASQGAELVNDTHATCTTPQWPGPITTGAICSPNMRVQITKHGIVQSQKQVFFTFDLESRLIV